MGMRQGLMIGAAGAALAVAAEDATVGGGTAGTVLAAVAAIRAEALRRTDDPAGRPLPLAAHWHRMTTPLEFQFELIARGHHLLPWTPMVMPDPVPKPDAKPAGTPRPEPDLSAIRQLAAWKLPFALITGGQWEADLYSNDLPWAGLPPENTPLVWLAEPAKKKDGTETFIEKKLSPFGAVAPWAAVGARWGGSSGLRRLAEAYPAPDLVLIVSNNEAAHLKWKDAARDRRFLQRHATPGVPALSAAETRRVVGDGWIERYRAMNNSLRAALPNDAWRRHAKVVAYSCTGLSHFGREAVLTDTEPWTTYSLATPERLDPGSYMWDGAISEFYDNHWQGPQGKALFGMWSCQTEAMNQVFQNAEVLERQPDFWFETIFWDGDISTSTKESDRKVTRYAWYAALGLPDSPARYEGWVQYVMWTLTPRVAREWRASNDGRERWWPHFERILAAVDRVHHEPVLTRFWRQGALVPNRAHPHPFAFDIPATWQAVDRWFNLDTSLDPARPWDYSTRLPVFALARVLGQAGARQWLLYAHAPLGDRAKVEIAIPDYRKVSVDVAVAGSFYLVQEADGSVAPVAAGAGGPQ